MAKHKYGMQKPIQNELQQCINSFERMKRGGIGIADELVNETCKIALKYIDVLESKLSESEPIRHGHWILLRESEITGFNPEFAGRDPIGGYQCSNCKKEAIFDCNDEFVLSSYCPECGAKMDGENNG